jgi:hypothetical protein
MSREKPQSGARKTSVRSREKPQSRSGKNLSQEHGITSVRSREKPQFRRCWERTSFKCLMAEKK